MSLVLLLVSVRKSAEVNSTDLKICESENKFEK